MKLKKTAILTSKSSWFVPYTKSFSLSLRKKGYSCDILLDHKKVKRSYDVVFIISYLQIVNRKFLNQNRHNLVAHESDLPKGKGFAPLFWQVLEGKNKIPVVLFEATVKPDAGDIYLKGKIELRGYELHDEIRQKQAEKSVELCLQFLKEYPNLKPKKQKGRATWYKRRRPKDSQLSSKKSLQEQFSLLRTVNNDEFPAFFLYKGRKYLLEIYEEKQS